MIICGGAKDVGLFLDFETGRVLIVNQSFARHVFGGRNPIGQRIRIVDGEVSSFGGEHWYEVVGMVKDFGWQLPEPQEQSAMYRPSLPVVGRAGQLAVRVRDPEAFATRLRALTADVDLVLELILHRKAVGESHMLDTRFCAEPLFELIESLTRTTEKCG